MALHPVLPFTGTSLDLHEHIEIEQTWVISGAIVDDEGEVREGNFVWRPAGNRPQSSKQHTGIASAAVRLHLPGTEGIR